MSPRPPRTHRVGVMPRWLRTGAAVAAIAGAAWLDRTGSPGAAIALYFAAVIYTAWTAGRPGGLGAAVIASALAIAHVVDRAEGANPSLALVHSAPWVALFVLLALATSAIEIATRPPHRGPP